MKVFERPFRWPANKELLEWRQKAHAVFDPLWKEKMRRDGCSKSKARNAAYTWLSRQLDIDFRDCHISQFDVEMCKRVEAICLVVGRKG